MRTLDPAARKNVEIMAASIVNKIIHDPITSLKDESQEDGLTSSLVMVRRLFKLDSD
jgi:glutamyl-tRNA reductase